MSVKCLVLIPVLFIAFSCDIQKASPPLFKLVAPQESGIFFSNDIFHSDSLIKRSFEYLFNGSGVAIADFNKDSLPDIFFTGNMVSNRLYLNQGNFTFKDITKSAGLETVNKWSSGVAVADINQDGWMDIYVCVGGLSTEPEARKNLLYINQQDNTFQEAAEAYGLADVGYSIHAGFFDYDKDGDLDLYLLTTELDPYSWTEFRPRRMKGEAPNTDRLYRNEGKNTFTNVSEEAGILIEGYGLGLGFFDINEDGWTDIYVANDFLSTDIIYVNNQDGTFTDKIHDFLDHSSRNSMGVDLADFNNDGHTDIMVVDMLPKSNRRQKSMFGFFNYDKFQLGLDRGYQAQYARNTLQLNNGNQTFSELGQLAGIDQTDWSWTPLFADFDNDGWQDLIITNGYRQDITNMDFATYSRQLANSPIGTEKAKEDQMYVKLKELAEIKEHNFLYKNTGTLSFEDKSKEWGFDVPSYSNGAVYADLDRDGDLDIVVSNIDAPAFLYKNQLITEKQVDSTSNFLRVQLVGDGKAGLGASIKLSDGINSQYRYVNPYRGYLSTLENIVHFGLGKQTKVETLTISWSDGKMQELQAIPTNQTLVIDYENAQYSAQTEPSTAANLLFTEVSDSLNISYVHQENDFADFKVQPILPHKHSQNGPGIAVGDVNGDGLEDFYVGGSAGFPGGLFYQNQDGSFQKTDQPFEESSEDMGSLFFDADNDGDLDLYVVNGGSTQHNNNPLYPDHFYVNDGTGNFQYAPTAIPPINSSGSTVIAADYDKDGDFDLFVGGRVSPGKYPIAPQSYLLENNSQKGQVQFKDITPESMKTIGMVSAALWTDYDNDGWQDLMLVGEFMPITFFKNQNGNIYPSSFNVHHSNGWWNSLHAADLDNDGDMDYIIGNLGLNTRYKNVSIEEPLCVYAKDYDKNGRIDPVICYYIEGENYIAASRDMLIKQINSMRVRFKTYESYGTAPFHRSFTEEELSDAYILKSETFANSYLENKGKGEFELRALPRSAQIAPIFGALAEDVNEDGFLDVMLVGNSYATETALGQYDAAKGILLLGNGKGNFEDISVSKTGFFMDKDAKSLAKLVNKEGQALYLASRNNAPLKVFAANQQARHIPLQAKDLFATIKWANGQQRKVEFYYGNSYLSQSSRTIVVPKGAVSIKVVDRQNQTRELLQ
jgi:hypothetical protein